MTEPSHPLEFLHPRSLKHLNRHLQGLIKGRLWLKILVAMLLGVAVGILLGPSVGLVDENTAEDIGNWIAMPGHIFLGMIQMIVIPLVFASIIRGLASSEDMQQVRLVGSRLVFYFLLTTTVAIAIGLGGALLVQPGQYIDSDLVQSLMETPAPAPVEEEIGTPTLGEVPSIVVEILPVNPLGSMIEKEMLQVVLFAIIFGLALVSISPERSEPLLELMGSVQEVSMTIVRWAMLLAPFAVFGLLAKITIQVGIDVLIGMTVYMGTVLGGLLVLLLFYLLIIKFIAGRSPWEFLKCVREVQLLAFSTSSSAAVMPLSMETAEEKLHVRPSISQFLIPLGATINMDGTALYQGVATVFLAQVFGVELSLPVLLLVVVTTVGASIGSPATPGVGIVILAMVLTSAGIPTSGIALIIGVDRILDMSRTSINVTGDLTASLVMDRWVGGKKSIAELQMEKENC